MGRILGHISTHFTADQDTVDTIYRIILSVNQLSIYGAMAATCEEFEDHQDRTGQHVILVGQSIVLGEVKAETPVHDEDPMNDQIIWQQYIQQVESLSPENRISKFCKEAGFMRVVEVGQYFVTKDTGDFRQFQSVACREYTLPRDDRASQPKGWIQGNMRIGPVLEVTTSFQHFRYGIEIRIESVNQDNYHSWVRISYGTVKYVNDYIKDNTENLADPQEEQISQTSTSVVAAKSKAKTKPQPSHRDPEHIDFSVPRLARYMHSAWKRHQDAVFWVDIDLGIKEGLVFYQTRSNAIILQGTLPAHCIVKVDKLKTGERLYERRYLSPHPPPKISLKHDLNWSKGKDQGSTVEHQPVGKIVQQSLGETLQAGSSKPTQFPKPIEDRTVKLVTQEMVGKLQGERSSSDRTWEPLKDEDNRVMKDHDRTGKPVEASTHTHSARSWFSRTS